MAMLGPLAPSSMAIWPEAVSGSMLAMKKGLTPLVPLVARDSMASAMSPGPPTPEPKMTPTSSAISSSISSPAWATACLAAATPKTTFLSVRRTALKFIHSLGSKSLTSPAAWHGVISGSQRVISRRPLTPFTRLSQAVVTLVPTGLMMPRPVTATRRSKSGRRIGVRCAPVIGQAGSSRPLSVVMSSMATVVTSLSMRRTRPVRTLPGPTSMNVSVPAATMVWTAVTQSTPRVR